MEELIKYIKQLKADARATELDCSNLKDKSMSFYWQGQQDMASFILRKIKKEK